MIQYPSGKKATQKVQKQTITSGRGMRLEEDINQSNEFYRARNVANIHKKPTPIQVVKVDYPARNKARITEAYYRQASTTDYNGVYKGHAIDFEAKETKNKTSFPLSSLHDHQIEHLTSVTQHGAIAFMIIRFTVLEETYLVFSNVLLPFLKENNKRSIPIDWIKKNGYPISGNYLNPCDYIPVIDHYIKE